ncbi:hypothetical protein C0991_002516 [Blastosporella zonata]|nr:hypothetical protein C0991_002516 [Blastosporella zonata]
MSKRRRVNSALKLPREDDYIASDGGSSGSDASSFRGETTRKRKTVKKKRDAFKSTSSDSVERVCEGYTISHSSSSHIIKSPGPLQDALLQWYKTVHATRGMPWRKPYDPHLGPEERGQRAYEVWVSEIMLQQTQVATVIPYYTRWMDRFPTIRDLAAANVDQVNALWKGLGYYSRASRLLAGAQKAVAEYHGRLPDNAKDMEANIPGIGRYSAGAISSIAYGEGVPVLDGNVHRLLSRVLAVHAPPKAKATLDVLWAAAAAMVESTHEKMVEIIQWEASPWGRTKSRNIPETLIRLSLNSEARFAKFVTRHAMDVLFVHGAERMRSRSLVTRNRVKSWTLSISLNGRHQTEKGGSSWFEDPMEASLGHSLYTRRTDYTPVSLFLRNEYIGLLAGLYEFPTSSNVAKMTSHTAQAKVPQAILGQLLIPSVLPYNSGKKAHAPSEGLVIKSVKPISDVIHIFSHIKKTYRPQWVFIQGGESPPALKLRSADDGPSMASQPNSTNLPPRTDDFSRWVRLEDVSEMK